MPLLFRKLRSQLFFGSSFRRLLIYVVGETFLVVIGILLALQVNNWNQRRLDAKEEQTLLRALKKEMNDNLDQIHQVIAYNTRSERAAVSLLNIYNDGHRKVNSTDLDSLFAEVQWAWTFNPKLGILNSIRTNGKISLIQNHAIQSFVASFEEMTKDSYEESVITRSLIIDKYAMAVSKYISLNARVKYIGFDVVPSKFSSNYTGIFNDREIESMLTYIYVWRKTEIEELDAIRDALNKNIAIIDSDIKE